MEKCVQYCLVLKRGKYFIIKSVFLNTEKSIIPLVARFHPRNSSDFNRDSLYYMYTENGCEELTILEMSGKCSN